MTIAGANAHVFFDEFDPTRVITGTGTNTTTAKQWYRIIEKAAASSLPFPVDYIFKSPNTTQITLKTGDKIYPFVLDRICKTTADISAEQGTIDTSDDCHPGTSILDGNIVISGSIEKLFQYHELTGEFDLITDVMVNRFFDIATDSGVGVYTLTPRNDGDIFLLINLNAVSRVGMMDHFICLPIIISSMSLSMGISDVQKQSMSWTRGGHGAAVIYKVAKTA
ncbi:MAG: hypothetical protein LBT14_07210 [Treponema sp.]|jgi:hypothetical protein|nr:hypothetical protein [Treponema sp.]